MALVGCGNQGGQRDDGKLNIVATTTMLADAVKVIGGDNVNVECLMGPGIDPHLYKASAGDVAKMQRADMIIYNGLHLEGKMGDIFESMTKQNKAALGAAETISEDKLITGDSGGGNHDPHVWFNVELWIEVVKEIEKTLSNYDQDNKETYKANADNYIKELGSLHAYVEKRVEEVPGEKRVLITAHDAFGYFGDKYGFEVMGLQGLSTATEAGTADVKKLADYITENKIPAIFVESSVPPKNIEALQNAVVARGFKVEIGGELFSDSLGDPGSEEGTYIGTVKHNIDIIVDALIK
ncbi:metal ABC transporter solute-binding protein, Zn/Mn family [Desulfotomaculum sp. 1211_IL3151]|uniref:metal ABC transporter solute-binding protein, Zn/Mn family n=1 Tax=Desulfotomaculum sp. 1211_IL3151 TaxID=3084055 RepID=UPI003FA5D82A